MAAVSRSRCRATLATRKGNKASHGPPHGFFSSPKRLADLPYGFFSSPKWLEDLPYGFFSSPKWLADLPTDVGDLPSGWRTSHTDFSASKAVGGPPIRIFRPPKRLADLPYGFFGLQSGWRTSHTDFSASKAVGGLPYGFFGPASPFPHYSSPASWLKSSFEPLSSPRAACRSLSTRSDSAFLARYSW